MPDRAHIGLDNPAFDGRLRQPNGGLAQLFHAKGISGAQAQQSNFAAQALPAPFLLRPLYKPKPKPEASSRHLPDRARYKRTDEIVLVVDEPVAVPVAIQAHQPQASQVLHRQSFRSVSSDLAKRAARYHYVRKVSALIQPRFSSYSKLQYALMSMAVLSFIIGVVVSTITLRTNHVATKQVAALAKTTVNQAATSDAVTNKTTPPPPSTTPPSTHAVSNYAVGPTMPRYLNIPKLGVHARVLSLGILNNGALATPNNVFDVGWYNESTLPGQPGAMLIDGHVSSWTSHGVFYGIKKLVSGDEIQVVRGDGTVFNYQVVRNQVFDHNDVDMQAAVTPVDPNAPGLNLITCTGDVISGTNEFNERILVFAKQV